MSDRVHSSASKSPWHGYVIYELKKHVETAGDTAPDGYSGEMSLFNKGGFAFFYQSNIFRLPK